jgi:hypothetical protein
MFIYKTYEEMRLAEKILVIVDHEISYNMCRGGQGGWDYVHSNNLNPNGKLHAKRMAENKCYKVLNSWQTVGTQAARKNIRNLHFMVKNIQKK